MLEIISNQGTSVLLATIAVGICLNILLKVAIFLWDLLKKKTQTSDDSIKNLTEALTLNTQSIEKLSERLEEVEEDLSELAKIKKDLQRLYAAIKFIAGDDWSQIRKEIIEDELTKP